MIVGVVDSGLLPADQPVDQAAIGLKSVSVVGGSGEDTLGHGSRVVELLLAGGLSPPSDLISYRCTEIGQAAAVDPLAVSVAIDLAVAAGCRLVNCSLGICRQSDALLRAVARARAAEVLVVASFSPKLPWIARVGDALSVGLLDSDDAAAVRGPVGPYRLGGLQVFGVSYATATVSGQLSKLLGDLEQAGYKPTVEDLLTAVKRFRRACGSLSIHSLTHHFEGRKTCTQSARSTIR